MHASEIDPNAQLALATAEIRHPAMDSLRQTSSTELKRLLAEYLPIERQAQDANRSAASFGGGPSAAERFVRFTNRDNTVAASLRTQSILVEATAHDHYQSFIDLVMRVVDARSRVSPIVGVERLGLRYIFEIRVPASEHGRINWGDGIDQRLLGPNGIAPGLTMTEWQGAAVFRDPAAGSAMVVRYGPAVGPVVAAGHHLRPAAPPQAQPYFLADIDSFWAPAGTIPEYNREEILSKFRHLYRPVMSAVQNITTGDLEDELIRQ